MIQIFKNLMRYKTATILNLIGLSTAFAAFIIIGMQVRYDFTYDKSYENYKSIYVPAIKIEATGEISPYWNNTYIDYLRNNFPEIEHLTVDNVAISDPSFTIKGDDMEEVAGNNTLHYINHDATEIFSFKFTEGDPDALKNPTNIIISTDIAKKYFGNTSPLGNSVQYQNGTTYTIAAVFESLPENSTFKGDMFMDNGSYVKNQSDNWNYDLRFQLADGVDIEDFNEKVNQSKMMTDRQASLKKIKISYISIPLVEVRSVLHGYDNSTPLIMGTIALVLIILAFINFVNFAISMVPLKIKGVNIRKISGATVTHLRANVMGETLILIVISFILAIVFVTLFKDSSLSYIISDMDFQNNISVYITALSFALLMGLVSGLYPAIYSTSFQPALILKSSYALSHRGIIFRKLLIGFQFFVAISFIAISIFVTQQYLFITTQDKGYETENIIAVSQGYFKQNDAIKDELLKHTQIKDITFAGSYFGVTRMMHWGRKTKKGKDVGFHVIPVEYNFLDFFDIKILSGTNFIQSYHEREAGTFILNQQAMDEHNLTLDDKINGHNGLYGDIVGVCDNAKILNLKLEMAPFCFYIFGKKPWYDNLPVAYIKITGNVQKAITIIRDSYTKVNPEARINLQLLNDRLDEGYIEEHRAKSILQFFSFLAIVIALVGVFGLVSFDTRFRRKEIGLRKVHGATIGEILRMFSTNYVKIVFISFVLSVPVVYYLASEWLQQFPYRIELSWWVFVVALLMVLGLTVTISFIQTYRSASENPIKSIKTE